MPSEEPRSKADERLSQLLRMKRQERPDATFWDRFDEELRSKQLGALVRTQAWYERAGTFFLLIARKSAAATAAVSVFALGIFAISRSDYFADQEIQAPQSPLAAENSIAMPSQDAAPIFVVEESFQSAHGADIENAGIHADAPHFYEVHALHPQSAPKSYQVIASPKQFTAGGTTAASNGLGAKVIRVGNRL